MPEVVRSSPMREENEAQHENRHEKKILSDHDALLLLFPLPKTGCHFARENDVTEGTLARDGDHKQEEIVSSTAHPPRGAVWVLRSFERSNNCACGLSKPHSQEWLCYYPASQSTCRAAFASCPRRFPETPSSRNRRRAFPPWARSSACTLSWPRKFSCRPWDRRS